MAYMQSNEPINKMNSNEGFWGGAGIGAASGLATAGVAHVGANLYSKSEYNPASKSMYNKMDKMSTKLDNAQSSWDKLGVQTDYQKFEGKQERKLNNAQNRRATAGKAFSGGLKKSAIYGGSILLGGAVGGTIDHMN